MLACAEVDGNKSKPNDASCVHWESDELGLIECFWNLPCEDSIHGADDHQQYGVRECYHVACIEGCLVSKNCNLILTKISMNGTKKWTLNWTLFVNTLLGRNECH